MISVVSYGVCNTGSMLAMLRKVGVPAELYGLIDRAKLCRLYDRYLNGGGYLNGRYFYRVCAFEAFLRRFDDHLPGCGLPAATAWAPVPRQSAARLSVT